MRAQSRLFFGSTSCLMILLSATVPAVAGDTGRENADREFQRAYFLETHDANLDAAAEAYERVLSERKAAAPILQEAKARLAGIHEEQAAGDFARLMPPDALVYAELSNPGRHVAQLARLLNLVADPHAPPAGKGLPLDDGFYLRDPLTISPALLVELEKSRGVAVAITEFDVTGRHPPHGVLVAHPGQSDILRGLLETSLQVIEPTEPIGGFATCTYMGQVWITRTERLVIVATSREAIEQTVDRLHSDTTGRLSDEPLFVRSRRENDGALLYAWVNGPRMLRQFEGQMRGEEAMIARAILDLAHMQSVSLAVTTTKSGLAARARLDLADDHQNLVYGLVRTAPLTRKSLEYIPQGAAGLAIIGLNRPVEAAPTPNPSPADAPTPNPSPEDGGGGNGGGSERARQLVSAMDLGREFFANIHELAFFVLPEVAGEIDRERVPEMGLVIATNDSRRSEALWNQLLALPMILLPELGSPEDVELSGFSGREFCYPDAPPVVLVRLHEDGLLLATRGAADAAAEAARAGETIMSDGAFKPLIDGLTPATSKAVLVDVGRSLAMASTLAGPHDAELQLAAQLVGSVRFSLVTDEAPTAFTIRADVSHLPDVQAILRAIPRREVHSIGELPAAREVPATRAAAN